MGPLFAVLILASPAIEQRKVTGHDLQYLVSLPQGWTAAKQWPARVVIDSARREPPPSWPSSSRRAARRP
jgi:hypothetical protein